jgi:hypothetical protein
MKPRPNKITPTNAGGRLQFRFRGSRHRPGVAEFRRSAIRIVARLVALPAVRRWGVLAILGMAVIALAFGDMLREGQRKARARGAIEAERAAILASAEYRLGVEEEQRHARVYPSSSMIHFPAESTNWSDDQRRDFVFGFLGRTNVP